MNEQRATTSSRHRSNDKTNRANRGLTCANCRLRKTRCDGTQPGCKTCEVYRDECRYEKAPPMTQIIAMAKRLQDTEHTVEMLRRQLDQVSSGGAPAQPEGAALQDSVAPRPLGAHVSAALTTSLQADMTASMESYSASDDSRSEERLLSDLSLDEHGELCYYGPTSAVHAPPALGSESINTPAYGQLASELDARSVLTSNALESKTWEEFALGNAALQTDIPRHIVSRLLQIHWTWIAPMFMWVYRPAFMRDMAIGGPSYSPFLLTVMCAHSARFDQGRTSELLISRARLLLGNEIHRPSCIPTVQALLQLSARDLAYGSISQAWLYSGMAFRMVSDLGLHHSTANIKMLRHIGAEDLEIRRRLFWSCYFWDKAISLYLGRMPVLPDLPFGQSPQLLDDSAEHDIWSPYSGVSINLSRVPVGEYPTMKSHVVSCFENSCKLAVILNDIILNLYSRRSNAKANETSLRGIKTRLDEWRQESPAHLKYEPDDLPAICPPPHLLTQNLLYYTAVILLHRPFYSTPTYHETCLRAAESIEKLVLLLEKTFGFSNITYLMAYCIYTGASVMIQEVKTGDLEANVKMQTFLHALRQGITTCPIVQRSLDIITDGLRSDNLNSAPRRMNNTGVEEGLMPRNYLPAFPYRGFDMYNAVDTGLGGMDTEDFSMLDSFPENHFDTLNGGVDWFMPP